MCNEILLGQLHNIKWMFPYICFILLGDPNQCPPCPAREGSQLAFGARNEETLINNCRFLDYIVD